MGRSPSRGLSGSGPRSIPRSLGIQTGPAGASLKQQTGYPSPPTTPELDLTNSIDFPLSDDHHIHTELAPSPPTQSYALPTPPPRPRVRVASVTSLYSLRPPRSPFAVRTPSIASISTLPPDFGRYAQVASGWATEPTLAVQNQNHSVSNPTLDSLVRPTPPKDKSSASPAWRKAIANKLGRLRPIWPIGSDPKPRPSKATALLTDLLKKDDASAGEGMYWASAEEEEALIKLLDEEHQARDALAPALPQAQSSRGSHAPFSAVASSSGTRTLVASARPPITQRRSFVDPTATAAAQAADDNKYLRPPQGSSSRRGRHVSSPLAGGLGLKDMAGTDPVLLELERKSRVGVKTKCASCRKQGYNFPATKEGKTFCSRECRRGLGQAV